MKRLITAFAILGLVLCGGQAVAEIGTIDDVPAASLLLPYFEVDLNNPGGTTTLFSINNASAAPAIAHVVLWTDLSIPTIDFDVYLTGYDVQTINVRDLFNGQLPLTSHPTNDVDDLFSPSPPEGAMQSTVWDPAEASSPLNISTCDRRLPFDDDPNLYENDPDASVFPTQDLLDHVRGAHTGNASPVFDGACSAQPFDDGIARGYITVDSVTECSLEFPDRSDTYWGQGGTGIANNNNVLWGDYFLVDPENNFAQGESLVHIEADAALSGVDTYTFYGRWDSTTGGIDNRESLGTSYATRYLADAPPFDGTDLLVWRDAKQPDATSAAFGPFVCGTDLFDTTDGTMTWYPLEEREVAAFDEEERVTELCGGITDEGPISPPRQPTAEVCFPAETQRVPVSGTHPFADPLDVPYDFGWLFLNLNHAGPTAALDVFGGIAQSWVSTLMAAEGRFSVGIDAIQLDNANDYGPAFDVNDTPTIVGPGAGY